MENENDAIKARTTDDIEESEETVVCQCGCITLKALVMNASMGTCCPDCYDEMSD